VEAIQGGIYIVNNDNPDDVFLELAASNSFNKEKNEKKRYSPGEGLVGACFQSRDIIEINDVPDTYLKVESGLGGQKPGYLLLLPVKYNTDVEGVIELASFNAIKPYRLRFIEKLAEMLVPIVSTIKSSSLIQEMYAKTREQSEELQAQEEEMRQQMEEMRAAQEESDRIKVQLEEQIEKLKKDNGKFRSGSSDKKKH
jgi:methyl-accepting chemotaxis protein